MRDDSFLLLINAHSEDIDFTMPSPEFGERWEFTLNTAEPRPAAGERAAVKAREQVEVAERSLIVLRRLPS